VAERVVADNAVSGGQQRGHDLAPLRGATTGTVHKKDGRTAGHCGFGHLDMHFAPRAHGDQAGRAAQEIAPTASVWPPGSGSPETFRATHKAQVAQGALVRRVMR
jgi:hypothetical protein